MALYIVSLLHYSNNFLSFLDLFVSYLVLLLFPSFSFNFSSPTDVISLTTELFHVPTILQSSFSSFASLYVPFVCFVLYPITSSPSFVCLVPCLFSPSAASLRLLRIPSPPLSFGWWAPQGWRVLVSRVAV